MNDLINKEVELRIEKNDGVGGGYYISVPCKIIDYQLETYRFDNGGWNENMIFYVYLEPLDHSVIDDINVSACDFNDVSLDEIFKL